MSLDPKELMKYTKKDLVNLIINQFEVNNKLVIENGRALTLMEKNLTLLESMSEELEYIKDPVSTLNNLN